MDTDTTVTTPSNTVNNDMTSPVWMAMVYDRHTGDKKPWPRYGNSIEELEKQISTGVGYIASVKNDVQVAYFMELRPCV